MKAELSLIISLLNEDDWKRAKAWSHGQKAVQKAVQKIDGFEISLALAYSFLQKDWTTLEKLKAAGLQIGLRLPNVKIPLSEATEFAWREVIDSFRFSWIFREGGWPENPRPIFRFLIGSINPFYKSEQSITESGGEHMVRIDGAHESRWIRRYGEAQIHSVHTEFAELVSGRKISLVTLSYSGRWEEIHHFRKGWF